MTEDSLPRVAIIVENLPVPFDQRVWLEATTLQKAGHTVSVIGPKAKGYDESYEYIDGVHVYRYNMPIEAHGALSFIGEYSYSFLRSSMKLARVAREQGFDVLHVCNPPEIFFPLGWIAKRFRKAFLFDHHDLSPEMYMAKFENPKPALLSGLTWLEEKTFGAADVVVTTNQSHKDIAIERGGCAPDDVFIVRSAPREDRFSVRERNDDWRNGRPHLIAYLGEICEQDGVDHLIRAMSEIVHTMGRTDVQCVVMGGGADQPRIKRYSEELGLQDFCHFTGRVSDEIVSEVFSTADVGVDPDPLSEWSDKSTMNKIMEYMFFALPVVAYELTEAKVSAGDAALFVEPNNEVALAKGILELLENPERRAAMGSVGQDRIRDALGWQHSVTPLLAAYERVEAKRIERISSGR